MFNDILYNNQPGQLEKAHLVIPMGDCSILVYVLVSNVATHAVMFYARSNFTCALTGGLARIVLPIYIYIYIYISRYSMSFANLGTVKLSWECGQFIIGQKNYNMEHSQYMLYLRSIFSFLETRLWQLTPLSVNPRRSSVASCDARREVWWTSHIVELAPKMCIAII